LRTVRNTFSSAVQPDDAIRIGGVASMQKEDDMDASAVNQGHSGYELRFRSLFKPGRGLSFDCDPSGQVDLDALSERARSNYLYARTVIGREFLIPVVQPRHLH
jgi:hypothetical protein